jgi:hypothetical protein
MALLNLTAICEPIVLENVGASTSDKPMGLHGLVEIALLKLTAICEPIV